MTVPAFIRNCNNPELLYPGIRKILESLYRAGKYPEDCTIKRYQRLADKRYAELEEKNKEE